MPANAFEATTTLAEPAFGRVLLVDDEPELRRLLRRALVRAGFEVVEAADGGAALEAARKSRFDVVISDVRMPRLGGLELLERLQLEEPNLPVVLMSGSTELPTRQSAVDLGAFDYLAKPIALGNIQAVASRAVAFRQQRGADPSGADDRASCERLLSPAALAASSGRK